jgi:hypothetical protein
MHNVDYLIGKLKEKVDFESVHIEELPAQTAKFGSLDNPLHSEISEGYLNSINIDHLYRGGYLPLERRKIEKHLFRGDTDIVISTNALELGIDIGSLDGCLLIG